MVREMPNLFYLLAFRHRCVVGERLTFLKSADARELSMYSWLYLLCIKNHHCVAYCVYSAPACKFPNKKVGRHNAYRPFYFIDKICLSLLNYSATGSPRFLSVSREVDCAVEKMSATLPEPSVAFAAVSAIAAVTAEKPGM